MSGLSEANGFAQITAKRISVWNDERVEFLKEKYANGWSCSQIAFAMPGVTRNAVIGKVHRLGLVSPAIKKVKKAQVPRELRPKQAQPVSKIVLANGHPNSMRVFKKVAAQEVKLRAVEIVPLNVSLSEVADNGCRYIAGNDHLFCGHPQKEGSSYCVPHDALCRPEDRRAA